MNKKGRVRLNSGVFMCQGGKGSAVLTDFCVNVTQSRVIGEEEASGEEILTGDPAV